MTDWVRVKHADTPTHEYTVTRSKADKDPKLTILDRPVVDINGVPLPATIRRPKATPITPTPATPASKETK